MNGLHPAQGTFEAHAQACMEELDESLLLNLMLIPVS